MAFDDFYDLDIDLNNLIDEKDLAMTDLDNDGIPDSIDTDLAGIVGIGDKFELDLVGLPLPDEYEVDLNKNSLVDKFEKDMLGGPLKRLGYDFNKDGNIDAIDAMILRNLIDM
ncbi:hypothetical protein ACWNXI_18245 [Caldibacillus thermoamylovorans]